MEHSRCRLSGFCGDEPLAGRIEEEEAATALDHERQRPTLLRGSAMTIRSKRAGAPQPRWSAAWLAWSILWLLMCCGPALYAGAVVCDAKDYKAGIGPAAIVEGDAVVVTWGQPGGTA